MLSLIAIGGLLALGCISHREKINPITIMTGTWGVAMLLYCSGIVEYGNISLRTYLVIIVGLTAFSVGALLSKKIRFKYIAAEYIIDNRIIIALQFLTILLLLPDAINSILLLASGATFEAIRTNTVLGASSVLSNPVVALIKNYIVNPFTVLVYPLTAYVLVVEKRRKTKFRITVLAIMICLCQVFSQGGRVSLVYLAMHIVIVPRLFGYRMGLSAKTKRRILLGTVVMSVVFYVISISRGISNMQRSLVLYVSGCVPLMDYYLNNLCNTQMFTYGGAFLEGILRLVFTLAENIGIPYPNFVRYVEGLTNFEQTVTIGNDLRMNAFVSCFYYFYLDGGMIMVFLESMIYGFITEMFYKKAKKGKNPKYIVIYALFIQTLVFSLVRFQFILPSYVIAIIMASILFKKKEAGL